MADKSLQIKHLLTQLSDLMLEDHDEAALPSAQQEHQQQQQEQQSPTPAPSTRKKLVSSSSHTPSSSKSKSQVKRQSKSPYHEPTLDYPAPVPASLYAAGQAPPTPLSSSALHATSSADPLVTVLPLFPPSESYFFWTEEDQAKARLYQKLVAPDFPLTAEGVYARRRKNRADGSGSDDTDGVAVFFYSDGFVRRDGSMLGGGARAKGRPEEKGAKGGVQVREDGVQEEARKVNDMEEEEEAAAEAGGRERWEKADGASPPRTESPV